MAKNIQTKPTKSDIESQQLIWGSLLFILFIASVIVVFYFMENGGSEVLQAMK